MTGMLFREPAGGRESASVKVKCSLKYALLSVGGVDSSGTACLQFELSRGHFRLRDGAAGADGVHPGGRVYS